MRCVAFIAGSVADIASSVASAVGAMGSEDSTIAGSVAFIASSVASAVDAMGSEDSTGTAFAPLLGIFMSCLAAGARQPSRRHCLGAHQPGWVGVARGNPPRSARPPQPSPLRQLPCAACNGSLLGAAAARAAAQVASAGHAPTSDVVISIRHLRSGPIRRSPIPYPCRILDRNACLMSCAGGVSADLCDRRRRRMFENDSLRLCCVRPLSCVVYTFIPIPDTCYVCAVGCGTLDAARPMPDSSVPRE